MTSLVTFKRIAAVACVAVLFLVATGGQSDDGKRPAGASPGEKIAYRASLVVQLRVADLERSVRFYRDTLDMTVVHRNDALKWVKVSYGLDGVTIGLGQNEHVTGSGGASINVGVRDVDAARRLLEKRGVKFPQPTITIPGVVKLAELTDPDGNRIRLAQSLAAEAEGG